VVKIVVMASFNMDLVMRTERLPRAGETLQGTFAMHLGGKGFNQAIAARRLGAAVAVIGRVGDDAFGAAFLAALDREGIDRGGVTVDSEIGTGVASIVVDGTGENAILQAPRANRAATAARVAGASRSITGADAVLFQLEMDAGGCAAFAKAAHKEHARVVFNAAPATGEGADLLPLADLLVVNQIEARSLTPSREDASPAALVRALATNGRDVVITLGDRGAVAQFAGAPFAVDALAVPVTDTVGAGDAFCAALTVRLAERASPAEALRFAAAAGAMACTREGAEPSMPHRDEVESLLAKGGPP
jgi:ribokinase